MIGPSSSARGGIDGDVRKVPGRATRCKTLSAFLGQRGTKAAPAIDFIKPLTPAEQKTSLEFFAHPELRSASSIRRCRRDGTHGAFRQDQESARARRIDFSKLSPSRRRRSNKAWQPMRWNELAEARADQINTGKVTAAISSVPREYLKNNYLYRMTARFSASMAAQAREATVPLV